MTVRVLLGLGLALAALPALAQGPAETRTGGGPRSTARAPNTSAVGQTKPPGSAGAPISQEERGSADRTKPNNAIETGICIGCNK